MSITLGPDGVRRVVHVSKTGHKYLVRLCMGKDNECTNGARRFGLCNRCYKMQKITHLGVSDGKEIVEIGGARYVKYGAYNRKLCINPGCDKKVYKNGFCTKCIPGSKQKAKIVHIFAPSNLQKMEIAHILN